MQQLQPTSSVLVITPAQLYRACLRAQRQGRVHSGFTLVELLVASAILALLMALAAANFSALFHIWRVRQTTETLIASLYLARSEAIRLGGQVLIEKLPNNDHCNSASGNQEWGCGWQICHDENKNGKCDLSTEPLLHHAPVPGKLRICRRGGTASIAFDRWGKASGAFPSFNLRPLYASTNASERSARAVRMSSGGRIRSANSQKEDTSCPEL
ncbi:MAG: GspH/FimT family protein [Comamonas sp.]|nr:GspH/FimT family protein [Comamonas sp.]